MLCKWSGFGTGPISVRTPAVSPKQTDQVMDVNTERTVRQLRPESSTYYRSRANRTKDTRTSSEAEAGTRDKGMHSLGVDDMCTKHHESSGVRYSWNDVSGLAPYLAQAQNGEEDRPKGSYDQTKMVDAFHEEIYTNRPYHEDDHIQPGDAGKSPTNRKECSAPDDVLQTKWSATQVRQWRVTPRYPSDHTAQECGNTHEIHQNTQERFIPEELKNMVFQGYKDEQFDVDDYWVIHYSTNVTKWEESDLVKAATEEDINNWIKHGKGMWVKSESNGSVEGANWGDPRSLRHPWQLQLRTGDMTRRSREENTCGDEPLTEAAIQMEQRLRTAPQLSIEAVVETSSSQPQGFEPLEIDRTGSDVSPMAELSMGSPGERTDVLVCERSGRETRKFDNDRCTGGTPYALVGSERQRASSEPGSHASRPLPRQTHMQTSRKKYDIHLPESAGQANITAILDNMDDVTRSQIESIIIDPRPYDHLASQIPKAQRSHYDNKFTRAQVGKLLSSGVLEQAEQDLVFLCRVFTIDEVSKERSRLIIEPHDLNKIFQYPKTRLPTIMDLIKLTQESRILYQADLECFFYQIPLHPNIRKYFGVIINKKPYQLTSLPMGFVASVFVAQAIAATLVTDKEYNYIDNLFGGEMTYCLAKKRLKDIQIKATRYNIKIKAKSVEQDTSLNILGVKCNAGDTTICLATTFVERHQQQVKITARAMEIIDSVRGLMKLLGVILRGAYVLQIRWYDIPNILRLARDIARIPLDSLVKIQVPQQMRELAAMIIDNKPVDVRSTTGIRQGITVITDASLSGYGVIYLKGRDIYTLSGKWTNSINNMPALEARAITIAIQYGVEKGLRMQNAHWWTDSETVRRAAKAGKSKDPDINQAVKLINDYNISHEHVPSKANPADSISRGTPWSEEDRRKLDNLYASKTNLQGKNTRGV